MLQHIVVGKGREKNKHLFEIKKKKSKKAWLAFSLSSVCFCTPSISCEEMWKN